MIAKLDGAHAITRPASPDTALLIDNLPVNVVRAAGGKRFGKQGSYWHVTFRREDGKRVTLMSVYEDEERGE